MNSPRSPDSVTSSKNQRYFKIFKKIISKYFKKEIVEINFYDKKSTWVDWVDQLSTLELSSSTLFAHQYQRNLRRWLKLELDIGKHAGDTLILKYVVGSV